MLATYSLLPIVSSFCSAGDVKVELKDISLSGRILAAFADRLPGGTAKYPDVLSELGHIAKSESSANIIKLPNISASLPQLQACIAELQSHGLPVPNFPEKPTNAEETEIKSRYSKVLGSAVNPVLREGNSDRRCAASVKNYARKFPHRMSPWSRDSKTNVVHMSGGDFYGSERSHVFTQNDNVRIEFVSAATGAVSVLKSSTSVGAGEIIDGSVMSVRSLRAFYQEAIARAKADGVLFSVHLKATMMKVSDPILFGHAVTTFFAPVFTKYAATFAKLGVNSNNGLGDVFAKLAALTDASERAAIEADFAAALKSGPAIAMVNSDKGITNLHVPSDVIIDASMPAMIRDGGKMWNTEGKLADTLAVIPDRSYAGVYAATIEHHKHFGAFNPATMGSVANVGLMAQQAEEYGSHNKTFELKEAGVVRVVDKAGHILLHHEVEHGDIYRMCQVTDAAIQDWIRLAVKRARLSNTPAVFWLDANRAHDRALIAKVDAALKGLEYGKGLDLRIHDPVTATRLSLETIRAGKDIISVTGNVLRDYLTDLFPILELNTSAKMLSIVPLLAGGGLYETGAGGSAPKHVQQFLEEGYLRWDSLGEFLALQVSLEDLAQKSGSEKIKVLASTLDSANSVFLEQNRSPGRSLGSTDNRGSHFYLALYWTQAVAAQTKDSDLAAKFAPIAAELTANETKIAAELIAAQRKPQDVGGYYHPDDAKATVAMRPSKTFNDILARHLASKL